MMCTATLEAPAVDLVERWRAGDERAADEIFHRYSGRLIALAASRLSTKLASRVDPEDVVQSAYGSFFAGAREDRYDLGGGLWRLLVGITLHKLKDLVDWHTAEKRSVGVEHNFGDEDGLTGLGARRCGPSPAEAAALRDEVEEIMRSLEPMQRRVLELRLQGYQMEEIAHELRCCERTVIRTLKRVRQQLEERQFGCIG